MWSQKSPIQDIKQIWFAGVHCDVGGGYPEKESGLAKIAYKWMVDEAQALGLQINQSEYDKVLGKTSPDFAPPDPVAMMHNSMDKFWPILEFFPHRYIDMSSGQPVTKWKIPFFRPRYIPNGATIHDSVSIRIAARSDYRPPNLPNS